MPPPLPPWLDVRPQQFTEAAIAGGQLGQRTAQDASELAQRGIIAAHEIANRAEQLQIQREQIAAELDARRAATAQRAAEAQMEQSVRQQTFDLNKQQQDEIARRMGEKDAAWEEAMSRYQRALNAGENVVAADAEILQPLRTGSASGARTTAARPGQSDWVVVNTPSGPGRQNKVTGEFQLGTGYKAPIRGGPEDKEATSVRGKKLSSDLSIIDKEMTEQRKALAEAGKIKDENKRYKAELRANSNLLELNRRRDALFAATPESKPIPTAATAAVPTYSVPPSEIPIGAPKTSSFIGDPNNPVIQDPPMAPLAVESPIPSRGVTRIRVEGPNGERGTMDSNDTLPQGWKKI